jgi:1,4-alpha-glucan branching enzyme
MHDGLSRWIGDLNRVMRDEKALHELDFDPAGFAWIDASDAEQSVISFIRRSANNEMLIAVFNFTPVPRHNYQIGVPAPGRWLELLNSDAPLYGGSGQGNLGGVDAAPVGRHGHLHSLNLTLPPLGAIFLKPDPGAESSK